MRNPLDLSDDEIMAMAEPVAVEPQVEPEQDLVDTPVQEEEEEEPEAEPESEAEEEEDTDLPTPQADDAEADDGEDEVEAEDDAEEEGSEATDTDAEDEADTETEPEVDADAAEAETPTINYEAEHAKMLAPINAGGEEYKFDSVDDMRKLAVIGATANKQMEGLKPNLKLIKMLGNNGLMDEAKLSYLIDLDKMNPQAIAKLVRDSKIDPDTMDLENDNYKAGSYSVGDNEIELDQVVAAISGGEHYQATIDVVTKEWDEASQQIVFENPQLINIVNDHKQKGYYDKIKTEVKRTRMLGGLKGISDVMAYKQTGDRMAEAGAFNEAPVTPVAPTKVPVKVVAPKPVDKAVQKRKQAATITKTKTRKPKVIENSLNMPDEEFMKLAQG